MKLNVIYFIFPKWTSITLGIDPRLGTGMSGGVIVGKNKTPGAAIEKNSSLFSPLKIAPPGKDRKVDSYLK